MSTYRIGVVGFGKIARDQHLPAIAGNADFTLAGVADPHADLAAASAPGFRSQAEMFARAEVDVVSICTPPSARLGVALEALAAGKHVMIEKPPTATVSELFLIREAAERAGRVLFTAWHSQHNEAVDAARERLAGAEITSLVVNWKEDVHRWHPGQQWIWEAGGFGVLDPGINALSILSRIMPGRLSLRSAALTMPEGAQAPIAGRLEFALGGRALVGAMELDWRREAGEHREIDVTTADGHVIALRASGARLLVDDAVVVEGARAEYPRMYAQLAALLREGRSEVDADPLLLACDALALGTRVATGPVAP
jgi:D-galactose 1-dehydrogenase